MCIIDDNDTKIGHKHLTKDIQGLSRNAKTLNDLVLNYALKNINSTAKCSVIFTSINNKIPNEKSIIDYVITYTESIERVISMFINEKKKHAPFESRNFRNNIIITLYCKFVNETNNKKEKMENRNNSWNFTNN